MQIHRNQSSRQIFHFGGWGGYRLFVSLRVFKHASIVTWATYIDVALPQHSGGPAGVALPQQPAWRANGGIFSGDT